MIEPSSGPHGDPSGDDGGRIRDRSARLAARLRRTGPAAGTGVDGVPAQLVALGAPRGAAQPATDAWARPAAARDGAATGAWAGGADGGAAGSDDGCVATGAWDGAATGAWDRAATGAWDGPETGAWDGAEALDGDVGAEAVTAALTGASRVGGAALLAPSPGDPSAADLLNAPRRPLRFYVAPFGTPPFGNPPGGTPPEGTQERVLRARPVWGPPQREV